MSLLNCTLIIFHGDTFIGFIPVHMLSFKILKLWTFIVFALQVWEIVYSKDGSVKEVSRVMQLKGHKVIYVVKSYYWHIHFYMKLLFSSLLFLSHTQTHSQTQTVNIETTMNLYWKNVMWPQIIRWQTKSPYLLYIDILVQHVSCPCFYLRTLLLQCWV